MNSILSLGNSGENPDTFREGTVSLLFPFLFPASKVIFEGAKYIQSGMIAPQPQISAPALSRYSENPNLLHGFDVFPRFRERWILFAANFRRNGRRSLFDSSSRWLLAGIDRYLSFLRFASQSSESLSAHNMDD